MIEIKNNLLTIICTFHNLLCIFDLPWVQFLILKLEKTL